MSYEIQGKLIVLGDTIEVSDKFKKREFVIEKEENGGSKVWIDTIKFQAVQDKCDLLETLSIGDTVDISFNIKGNKWEKNEKVSYFNNLDAWKVLKAQDNTAPEEDDDLPF
jgi:hypothetical protein